VLRHTFATEALRRGVSLAALQRLLGHSDIKVTQLYLHLLDDDVRREYERAFLQAYPGPTPYQPWLQQQAFPARSMARWP
jgi:integrase/recombinase XerD